MKYIDAERLKSALKAQIKEREEWLKDANKLERQDQLWSDLNNEDRIILSLVNSLQQEQPEVDLDKEIKKIWDKCIPEDEGMGVEIANIHIESFDIIARHFFELGRLNARKEETK